MRIQIFLFLHFTLTIPSEDSDVTNYVPVSFKTPSGADSSEIKLFIPTRGELSLDTADKVYDNVVTSWNSVVETHNAGLLDPKDSADMLPGGLSKGEAWHHYSAGQAGVVDSARFLITFSMVPSVQTGGSPLHIAASLGHADTVTQLLEDGARVDAVKEDGNTALHSAAIMGHAHIVRILVEEGAYVEAVGNSGSTALMMAAALGHSEAVEELLKAGADPDTKHKFGGTTALHFAAEVGRLEVMSLLCQHGANVEAEKVTGGTALHTAADANMTRAVTVLVEECGAQVDRLLMRDTTALYLASQRGFTMVARELIRLGADVNFVMPQGQHRGDIIAVSHESGQEPFYPVKNTEVGNGATALHAAVENGHLDTAQMLLEQGAVQSSSMEGATPLVIALQYRHPHIALLLLQEHWSDPGIDSKVPSDGSSALFVASLYGYTNVVIRLLQIGANVNIKNRMGATPLSAALSNHHHDIVELLLEAGAKAGDGEGSAVHAAVKTNNLKLVKKVVAKSNVNSKGPDSQTPLHFAMTGNLDVVQYLLQLGADVNSRVESTQATPLHMAALHGRHDLISALLQAGAKLEPRAGDSLYGATPLYLAAQNGHWAAVDTLLAAGAKVDCRLRQMDVTPLLIAAERGHDNVVRLLLDKGASVNIRNWNGMTALALAAQTGHLNIVRMLLERGAAVNSRDKEGNTVLTNCVLQTLTLSTLPVSQTLLKSGADPNIRNNHDNFPLMILAQKHSEDRDIIGKYAELLLEDGAKTDRVIIDKISGNTQTVIGEAVKAENTELIEVLLKFNTNLNVPLNDKDDVLTPLGHTLKIKNVQLMKLFLREKMAKCYYHSDINDLSDCVELAIATRNSEIINLITSKNDKDEL